MLENAQNRDDAQRQDDDKTLLVCIVWDEWRRQHSPVISVERKCAKCGRSIAVDALNAAKMDDDADVLYVCLQCATQDVDASAGIAQFGGVSIGGNIYNLHDATLKLMDLL